MIRDARPSEREETTASDLPRGREDETTGRRTGPDPVASLQRAVGNQGMQSLLGDGSNDSGRVDGGNPETDGRSSPQQGATVRRSTGESSGPTGEMCPRCVQRFRSGKPLNCEECERSLDGAEGPTSRRSAGDGTVQAKLAVGSPDDEYERQADRVAERVMRAPDAADDDRGTASPDGDRPTPGATVSPGEIKRAPAGGEATPVDGEAERRIESATSGGQPLPTATRSFFEPRFGRDFGDVRVHTGREADRAARSIDAEAFTRGSDVVFRSGAYRPGTEQGRELLAHELTHVVQQEGGTSGGRIQRQGGGGAKSAAEIKSAIHEATSGMGTSEAKIVNSLKQADDSTLRDLRNNHPEVKKWIKGDLSGKYRKQALRILSGDRTAVKECCRPLKTGTMWDKLTKAVGVRHCWLKTEEKEAGMGPADEGPLPTNPIGIETKVTDHTKYDAESCTTYEYVSEECINKHLQIGESTGTWGPTNNCNTFVDSIIEKCDQEAYWDIESPFS